jgi:hypothetical protein
MKMLRIEFTGEKLSDILMQMELFAGQCGEEKVACRDLLTGETVPAIPEKKTRTKKAEAAKIEDVVKDLPTTPVVAQEAPASQVAATQVTKEDVINAVREMAVSQGAEAARTVLSRLGANKVSDLKPDQYGAALAACTGKAAK